MSYLDHVRGMQEQFDSARNQDLENINQINQNAYVRAETKKQDYLAHIARHYEDIENKINTGATIAGGLGAFVKHSKALHARLTKGKDAEKPSEDSGDTPADTPAGDAEAPKARVPDDDVRSSDITSARNDAPVDAEQPPDDTPTPARPDVDEELPKDEPTEINLGADTDAPASLDTGTIQGQFALTKNTPSDQLLQRGNTQFGKADQGGQRARPQTDEPTPSGEGEPQGDLSARPAGGGAEAPSGGGAEAPKGSGDLFALKGGDPATGMETDVPAGRDPAGADAYLRDEGSSLEQASKPSVGPEGDLGGNRSSGAQVQSDLQKASPDTVLGDDGGKALEQGGKELLEQGGSKVLGVLGDVGLSFLDSIPIIGDLAMAGQLIAGAVIGAKGTKKENDAEETLNKQVDSAPISTGVGAVGLDTKALTSS